VLRKGNGLRRAFITGLGLITPIGHSWREVRDSLVAGKSGIGPITLFDATDHRTRIAGEVRNFDPERYIDGKSARRMTRSTQFAVAAARQAIECAGVDLGDGTDVAVVMHTGGGGVEALVDQAFVCQQRGPRRVSPLLIPMFAPNMAAAQVSIMFGIRGPVVASTAACATGMYAFIDALHLIERNEADVVVAGATEAGLLPPIVAALANAGALSRRNDEPQKASRPFDRDREGFVFAEGAGAFVVESEEHARARGATMYAEILGGALTADAFHITEPDPTGSGAALAMSRALRTTGLSPNDIGYICAHGTGTALNDVAETLAIKKVFGEHAYRVPISSPKSMAGHLIGAAGCISAAACILAVHDGMIPPTINLDTPDPACDLDYVPNMARPAGVRYAMANGFAFGGQNAVAVFGGVN
jgi:3-oxoacyl-[acyl-carrier-protein] synthase II